MKGPLLPVFNGGGRAVETKSKIVTEGLIKCVFDNERNVGNFRNTQQGVIFETPKNWLLFSIGRSVLGFVLLSVRVVFILPSALKLYCVSLTSDLSARSETYSSKQTTLIYICICQPKNTFEYQAARFYNAPLKMLQLQF